MNEKELHDLLSLQGIRLFALSLGSYHLTLIHHNKSVKEWRDDIRRYVSEIRHLRSKAGWANDEVFNEMMKKLHKAGYFDVTDVVADVYEGRVASYSARIEDNPAHEKQADGFGHYGWGSKNVT